jgi:hypothetical protein
VDSEVVGTGATEYRYRYQPLLYAALHLEATGGEMTSRVLRTVSAALTIAVIPLFSPPRTLADEGHFTLHNGRRTLITHVYVSPSGQGEWGDDLLGREVLNPRESVVIYFTHYDVGSCFYDLRIVAHTGTGEGPFVELIPGIWPGFRERIPANDGEVEGTLNRVDLCRTAIVSG